MSVIERSEPHEKMFESFRLKQIEKDRDSQSRRSRVEIYAMKLINIGKTPTGVIPREARIVSTRRD